MSIYDELKTLQVIPDAFSAWEEYRDSLTEYVIENTKEHKSLAICGAGPCDDLNLKRLTAHFETITLIDYNMDAMKSAISKYKMQDFCQNGQIILETADFMGINEDEYRFFSDMVHRELLQKGIQTDIEQLCAYAMDILTPLYRKANDTELKLGRNRFDYVLAVGVHSQLNNMAAWLWDAFSQALGQYDGNFYTLVMQENEIAIRKFDDAMILAAKEKLIIGCETETLGQPGSVQGAIQGLQDMEERIGLGALNRTAETELLWPFHKKQGIIHRMKVEILEKQR